MVSGYDNNEDKPLCHCIERNGPTTSLDDGLALMHRAWALDFAVYGLGNRVWGLEFRNCGFRV